MADHIIAAQTASLDPEPAIVAATSAPAMAYAVPYQKACSPFQRPFVLLNPSYETVSSAAADEHEVPDGEWYCWGCARSLDYPFQHPTTPVRATA